VRHLFYIEEFVHLYARVYCGKNYYNNINKIKDDDNNNSIDNCDDISIVSVADSILDAFKNDVINETEFNTGNKNYSTTFM